MANFSWEISLVRVGWKYYLMKVGCSTVWGDSCSNILNWRAFLPWMGI